MKLNRPVTIGLILIIIIIVGFYFVLPKYKEVKKFQVKVAEKEAELKAKEEYFRKLSETLQKLTEHEENVKKINTALPEKVSLPPLIYFIQDKTLENGLILGDLNLQGTSSLEKKTGLKQTSFSLGVTGSYSAFRNFISSLEKSSRLIEISDVSFGALRKRTREEESPLKIYQFNLGIKVYSY